MTSPSHDPSMLSSSPSSIRGISPVRRRESVTQADISDSTLRPRISPTMARSFDPNDPDFMERQRTMDVDMALHLSRARRETVSIPSGISPYESVIRQPEPDPTSTFPSLSAHEQHVVDMARGDRSRAVDHPMGNACDEGILHSDRPPTPVDLHSYHINPGHDPSLLATIGPQTLHVDHEDPSASMTGLPTYQANLPPRSNFDFSPLEQFTVQERFNLGIPSPSAASAPDSSNFRRRQSSVFQPADAEQPSVISSLPLSAPVDGPSDFFSLPRPTRHRKLSQNNASPRAARRGTGGKVALFENTAGDAPLALPGRLFGPTGQLSTIPSSENLVSAGYGSNTLFSGIGSPGGPGSVGAMGGIINRGHDRPYRFSFYSNALSATIHARSLSELPAEGQSFEDLFSGVAAPSDRDTVDAKSTAAPAPVPLLPAGRQSESPRRAGQPTADITYGSNAFKNGNSNGKSGGSVGGDFEGNTWWLDVQSPTDEEMAVLSKVFSIHPLTTEDIQMEEAREKIELFRNYYLVCFRSFDQDPYSPTHLEPLNMYIIVFREGIISFHFRPTPHPQNVRRRIKQLKDYISVTSDWISYALIDDITDAFGPLIQSIEYEVDSIDELVLILKEAEQSDMLRRIGTCRKKVMGLLRLMGNKADVVKGLAKRCNENWRVAPTSDIGLYLSDIQDHLITMTQNLNHYEKILSRSHSNYLAQISIEMTDANNQINDVLSKMTALGTVLIPMNLITGIWGMNVHVPGQNVETYTWFASIVSALAAIAIIGGYTAYRVMIRR